MPVAKTDMTPADFTLPHNSLIEKHGLKPIRRYAYPPYNWINNLWLSRTFGKEAAFHVDLWLWGQRGNDYETHRRRVNRVKPIADNHILIAGCGTGRDIPSWLPYRPKKVTGVDLFNYERAWAILSKDIGRTYPDIQLEFFQSDILELAKTHSGKFDLIASDALLEHVKDIPGVLAAFYALLKPGGLLYASFGPLWYAWSGDHVSGYEGLAGGYNHLLLPEKSYRQYLNALGPRRHSEHDGRTWIENDLFSYLKPEEYIHGLERSGFRRIFVSAMIDPRAVKFLAKFKERRAKLIEIAGDRLTLLVSGMTIIYKN